MIENRLITSFVHVAEELHFRKAAERLHIAQPALSRQIAQLEAQLGVRLLERTKRKVALTPAGRLFLEHAYRIHSDLQKAVTDVRKVNAGEAGKLVVGFIHSSAFSLTPRILRGFRERYPDVQLELAEMTMAQQLVALQEKSIDIGILRPPISDARLATHVLRDERFVLAVPDTHPLAARSEVALADIMDQSFVLFSRSQSPLFHSRIIAMCEKAGFVPRVVQHATQIHTVMGLVSANMGLSIVPEAAIELNHQNVRFLEILDRPPLVQVVLAWRRADPSPIVKAFADLTIDRVSPASRKEPTTGGSR